MPGNECRNWGYLLSIRRRYQEKSLTYLGVPRQPISFINAMMSDVFNAFELESFGSVYSIAAIACLVAKDRILA